MRVKDMGAWVNLCDVCESPHVIVKLNSNAGMVLLCYSCAKARCPGWEIELHQRYYEDHIDVKYKAGLAKEMAE